MIKAAFRETATGSLLGFLGLIDDDEVIDCSDRMLSRLDARLRIDGAGVDIAMGTGIRDGFASESPEVEEQDGSISCSFVDLCTSRIQSIYLRDLSKLIDHPLKETDHHWTTNGCVVCGLIDSTTKFD